MYPVLLAIGPLRIFSLSVFLILSWISFSFIFWRLLRKNGIGEETIFNLTFYATLMSLVGSRLTFVLANYSFFADSWLKIIAIWVQPGLTLYGALISGLVTLVYLSRRYQVRAGLVLDSAVLALGSALMFGLVGGLLDGSSFGKMTNLAWAVRYVGQVGLRHPIQIYELIALSLIMLILIRIWKKAERQKWPYGLLSIIFFLIYCPIMFLLEFWKESSVYFVGVSANSLVLISIFAESLGAFYIKGGGREKTRLLLTQIKQKIYVKLSQRRSRTDQTSS